MIEEIRFKIDDDTLDIINEIKKDHGFTNTADVYVTLIKYGITLWKKPCKYEELDITAMI